MILKKNNNRCSTEKEERSSSFSGVSRKLLWVILISVVVGYCYFFYNKFVKPYSYRWKALYGEVKYPGGDVRGIDISHYQKKINWEELAKSNIQNTPIQFAYIKATEGRDGFDEYFDYNFQMAKHHRIARGAYHFFTTQSSGFDQARHFCNHVKLEEGDLPPVLDIEISMDETSDAESHKTKNEILKWLAYVENHYRVKPLIYASYRFKENYLNDSIFNQYPYWIAHYYVDSLEYTGDWVFWQHTDVGKINGIEGLVDIDLFNGSINSFRKLQIKK